MADGRTRSLLVVDDESRILSALRRALRREGYEILTAETPAAALRIVDERPLDAVMSDHKMPGMTGLQLLERVAERRPAAALMLITGWTEEIPRETLERIGVRALVTKPWDDAMLKATLRRVLDGDVNRRGDDSDTPDPSSVSSWPR